jgi:hypothetical protein
MKKDKVKIVLKHDDECEMEELSIEFNGKKQELACGNGWDVNSNSAIETLENSLKFLGFAVQVVRKKANYDDETGEFK